MSQPTPAGPALKVAEDLRGVKKGSRILPLLVAATIIVGFVAYAVERPSYDVHLITVEREAQLPRTGKELMVIAREGREGPWHFRLFDRRGRQVATVMKIQSLDENFRGRALIELTQAIEESHWDQPASPELVKHISRLFPLVTLPKFWFLHYPASLLQDAAGQFLRDYPSVLMSQLKTLLIVALYSLAPGLFGMVYRRAFWTWFGGAFLILFAINWGFNAINYGAVAQVHSESTESAFHFLEEAVLLLLIGFRLRRHSVSAIGKKGRRRAVALAAVLVILALAIVGIAWFYNSSVGRYSVEGAGVLLFLASILVSQSRIEPNPLHAKNIVVCLDGTWNQPGQKDFDHVAVTNVFKLFRMCKGEASRAHYHASQFKVYGDAQSGIKQIAFYYQGVGNKLDNSELGQMLGGGFGLGASAIVARAYLDVVKAYRPGDRIFIFGFSRGAAIARLVAGVIGRRGIPKSLWTLRLFGQHWLLWKSRDALDVKVEVLGCWDTVGSFGIAKNIFGIPFQRVNLLKDLTVSLCVKRAYHMLALDETRDSFEPTLMDPDPTAPDRIVEVWFSGNHSNVGGGYATDNLSDVTLDFLLRHISSGYAVEQGQARGDESWGLYLDAQRKAAGSGAAAEDPGEVDPDPRGTIRQSTGPVYSYAPRKLPAHAVIHDSVFERMYDSLPVYAPQSLFDLNQDFVKKRKIIETEVGHLVATASLEPDGSGRILEWSGRHLSLMKWSKYAALALADSAPLKQRLNPPAELLNPPPC